MLFKVLLLALLASGCARFFEEIEDEEEFFGMLNDPTPTQVVENTQLPSSTKVAETTQLPPSTKENIVVGSPFPPTKITERTGGKGKKPDVEKMNPLLIKEMMKNIAFQQQVMKIIAFNIHMKIYSLMKEMKEMKEFAKNNFVKKTK
ncbi:uncharacterized protein LOC130622368 [Hydractinia symbiolongicarpus]|uniref:uncharacterized protein LOC130622368 n=1 Tax=Hydractinia symbiolongicarpus TaxID=13093 RepID=UPI0025514E7A|nr:uncharacterized protein LOC130622368 [Hydractinia symbiolongicarpus]